MPDVKRDILFLNCQDGHGWVFAGSRPCGCKGGGCSVPVHQCSRCGDCDYGDNEEAREIVAECEIERQDGEEVTL